MQLDLQARAQLPERKAAEKTVSSISPAQAIMAVMATTPIRTLAHETPLTQQINRSHHARQTVAQHRPANPVSSPSRPAQPNQHPPHTLSHRCPQKAVAAAEAKVLRVRSADDRHRQLVQQRLQLYQERRCSGRPPSRSYRATRRSTNRRIQK